MDKYLEPVMRIMMKRSLLGVVLIEAKIKKYPGCIGRMASVSSCMFCGCGEMYHRCLTLLSDSH